MNQDEKGLIICGAQGSGKTRLTQQIARNHLSHKICSRIAGDCNLQVGEHKRYHLIIVDGACQMPHFAQICNSVPPVHRYKLVIATSLTMEELSKVNYIKESFTIITLSSIL